MEFSKFNGDDVKKWLFKIEQYFLLDKTLEASKIGIVALHLERCAPHWHKSCLKLNERVPSWEKYVGVTKKRFGSLTYKDPMAELKKLKLTSTLQNYLKAFDLLLDKAQLSESQALSCFLARLRHGIEMMVRMFNPKTLQEVYSLAKLQKALKNDPIVHG